jgi:3-oxoacyl-[acyl-carrier-protein] synthase II
LVIGLSPLPKSWIVHSVSLNVSITGVGLITPLGYSAAKTWAALISGERTTDHSKISLPDAPPAPRVTALARHAATEAVQQARWNADILQSPSTALIVGTSKGPIQAWLEGRVDTQGIAAVASGIAAGLPMGDGPRLTISAACSSGLQALIRAAMMLQSGQVDRALVVGVEASVHPLLIGSFQRLGVLAPAGYGCRPFDRDRRGFLMSDAAAAICLERIDPARKGSNAMARIDSFAMGADATHITGSDPSGEVLRRLLRQVIDDGGPVDLVHGHGTGTLTNDAIEIEAVEACFQHRSDRPVLYSHKGAIGHTLGAAGLVSVVINRLAHRDGLVPANANLHHPLATQFVELPPNVTNRRIRRSLAMAAGFGGPVAVVSLTSA